MSCAAVMNKEQTKEVKETEGRILKIKTGYNPNSSSIGVDVVIFFTAGAAMTVLFNTLAAVLTVAKAGTDARLEDLKESTVRGQGKKQG